MVPRGGNAVATWRLAVRRGGTDLQQYNDGVASYVRFERTGSARVASPASRPAFSKMVARSESLYRSITSWSTCPSAIRILKKVSPPNALYKRTRHFMSMCSRRWGSVQWAKSSSTCVVAQVMGWVGWSDVGMLDQGRRAGMEGGPGLA